MKMGLGSDEDVLTLECRCISGENCGRYRKRWNIKTSDTTSSKFMNHGHTNMTGLQ